MTPPRSIYASVSRHLAYTYALQSLRVFFRNATAGRGLPPELRWEYLNVLQSLDAAQDRFGYQLDSNPTMDPNLIVRLRRQMDWPLIDRARALRTEFYSGARSKLSALDQAFYARLRNSTRQARQYEHISRMVWEMLEADRNDWFPVFVTLTVRPTHYDQVFATNSRCFRDYIRTIRRQIGRRLGMSKRVADVEDIHRYFAVVERGGSGDRLHVHCLHWCKALPVSPQDPNTGRLVADRRQLPAWCQAWEFGFVTAFPVRTGPRDVYARLGWRWPVERVEGTDRWQPYPAKGPRAVANYMGKYIAKNYGSNGKDYWRCRMTRNLGLKMIRSRVESLPSNRLLQMLRSPLPMVKHQGRTVSHAAMRRLAARELLTRHGSRSRYVKALATLEPALSLHVRRMTGNSLIQLSKRSVDCRWLFALFDLPRREIPLRGLATGLSV